MSRRVIVVMVAVIALSLVWIGIGLGAASASDEVRICGNSRCRVEIDEDTGEVVIRTNVENLKTVDGYLVVKGGAE